MLCIVWYFGILGDKHQKKIHKYRVCSKHFSLKLEKIQKLFVSQKMEHKQRKNKLKIRTAYILDQRRATVNSVNLSTAARDGPKEIVFARQSKISSSEDTKDDNKYAAALFQSTRKRPLCHDGSSENKNPNVGKKIILEERKLHQEQKNEKCNKKVDNRKDWFEKNERELQNKIVEPSVMQTNDGTRHGVFKDRFHFLGPVQKRRRLSSNIAKTTIANITLPLNETCVLGDSNGLPRCANDTSCISINLTTKKVETGSTGLFAGIDFRKGCHNDSFCSSDYKSKPSSSNLSFSNASTIEANQSIMSRNVIQNNIPSSASLQVSSNNKLQDTNSRSKVHPKDLRQLTCINQTQTEKNDPLHPSAPPLHKKEFLVGLPKPQKGHFSLNLRLSCKKKSLFFIFYCNTAPFSLPSNKQTKNKKEKLLQSGPIWEARSSQRQEKVNSATMMTCNPGDRNCYRDSTVHLQIHSTSANRDNKLKWYPYLSKLVEDNMNVTSSQIAIVSIDCFKQMLSSLQDLSTKEERGHADSIDIFIESVHQLDKFLWLLARCEIMLNKEEEAREKEIVEFNKSLSEKELTNLWSDDYKKLDLNYEKRINSKKKRQKSSSAKIDLLNKDQHILEKSSPTNPKTQKKKATAIKKRVHFCCYDLSSVTAPQPGELTSKEHIADIAKLLIKCGKIGIKLFNFEVHMCINVVRAQNRKCVDAFVAALRSYVRSTQDTYKCDDITYTDAAMYLLNEFDKALLNISKYPFQENLTHILSSLIRFLLKSIFCAHNFLDPLPTAKRKKKAAERNEAGNKPRIPIPTWYDKIGTYVIIEDIPSTKLDNGKKNEINRNSGKKCSDYAEFVPYNAAECSESFLFFACIFFFIVVFLPHLLRDFKKPSNGQVLGNVQAFVQ
ncbi:hypothetical protein RFI_03283 [Reticulomyxa filosa]|uniref:Uncharacterized protein n=1 Tax=Reticulomyxa filosa TaxID=46433 RepID=X6P863_RETFI|nr:hypothetical protein RFI_03283 [Reticulomyxa filosa]|eukprot:ETO33822.1 hypothetical protein RFI_03283 [Reticulomyxa filosa]